MFVNGEQEQGRRLPINVGQVRAFESGIGGRAAESGRLKLKGRRPWNQGLTVWRSVETT
jgi:hypothetical protein